MNPLFDESEIYRQMFQMTPNAVIIIDSQRKIQAANIQAEKILGYNPGELTGLLVDDLISERFRKDHIGYFLEYQKSPEVRPMSSRSDLAALCKDGKEIYIGVSLAPLSLKGESFILVTLKDMTSKRQEEERNQQLNALFEQTADSVVITDIQGNILQVNRAFEKTTGYSAEEVIGKTPRIIKSEKHEPKLYEHLWKTILAGNVFRMIFTNKKKDGSLFHESQTINPIKNKKGEITRFVAIGQDVTEEKILRDQLAQVQKMEPLGQLAGGIAHDFNNLLVTIQGYADFIYKSADKDSAIYSDVQEIIKAGQRATSLVKQLLAFSRKQLIQPRVINLSDTLMSFQKMLRPVLMENIEIAVVASPALGLVYVDPHQIEQVLLNLAVNARDAMPNGGKLTIHAHNVKLDQSYAQTHLEVEAGDYVVISVSDTGVGMTAEVKAHIFEPFFTTKGVGKGTGLGLATCYGIIKQHKGYLSCYSEEGQGTIFRIYLPRIYEQEDKVIAETPTKFAVGGSERILLVEDDPMVRRFVEASLKRLGYQVFSAAYPDEAIKIFAENPIPPIDLLLTDIIMPKMSGKDLAKEIRKYSPNLKVLFMSGYTGEQLSDTGILAADIPFLEKPFTYEILASKLREILDRPARS